ncbi:GNAT family N-acetyltransferase [Paracoccus sp. (in: a-proteobacteria)]|uniref:GNAT family N-acetyltransferase n=1 Tax=Paracoccus sp. TaxID=267 RepID=UPI003A873B2E
MIRPWLTPPTGPRADLAARIAAPVPVIETERLRLRAPRIGDFETWEAIVRDAGGTGPDNAVAPAGAWLEFCELVAGWILRGHGLFAAETRKDARLVGFITLDHEQGDPEPELGWFLIPEARGIGLATEGATAIRDLAFGRLAMPALVSYADPDNAPSIAVARRLGATAEGPCDGCAVLRHHHGGAA